MAGEVSHMRRRAYLLVRVEARQATQESAQATHEEGYSYGPRRQQELDSGRSVSRPRRCSENKAIPTENFSRLPSFHYPANANTGRRFGNVGPRPITYFLQSMLTGAGLLIFVLLIALSLVFLGVQAAWPYLEVAGRAAGITLMVGMLSGAVLAKLARWA